MASNEIILAVKKKSMQNRRRQIMIEICVGAIRRKTPENDGGEIFGRLLAWADMLKTSSKNNGLLGFQKEFFLKKGDVSQNMMSVGRTQNP